MALMRWEAPENLSTLRRDMDRLLDDFFGHSPFYFKRESALAPNVEVSDTKEAVVVKAQVAGMSQDSLQVSVTDDALTLKGEIKPEEQQDEKTYHRREFRYGPLRAPFHCR